MDGWIDKSVYRQNPTKRQKLIAEKLIDKQAEIIKTVSHRRTYSNGH